MARSKEAPLFLWYWTSCLASWIGLPDCALLARMRKDLPGFIMPKSSCFVTLEHCFHGKTIIHSDWPLQRGSLVLRRYSLWYCRLEKSVRPISCTLVRCPARSRCHLIWLSLFWLALVFLVTWVSLTPAPPEGCSERTRSSRKHTSTSLVQWLLSSLARRYCHRTHGSTQRHAHHLQPY